MRLLALSFTVALAFANVCVSQVQPEDSSLPGPVLETARIIGALPEIQQLRELKAESEAGTPQLTALREQILEKVIAASLHVDAATAQIDNEIAQADELRGYLADKRDKAVNRANMWSIFAGGGLGATSAGLQLPSGQQTAASLVGIAGGALSSGLAISGIRAQHGSTRIFEFNSNMLAQFFDRPALEDSRYDPIVWDFLSQVAPTDPDRLTRRDRLLHTWFSLKRIDPISTAPGQRKVERVTSRPSDRYQMTIDDLEDRAAMLQDVRAKIAFLKRDLAALLASLPSR